MKILKKCLVVLMLVLFSVSTLSAGTSISSVIPGYVDRPKYIWKNYDEIYINSGVYHHKGTIEQLVYWDSQLNYTFTNLANSEWSYLYISDSEVVSAGTNLITASQLVDSLTEPIWSDAKHGRYNGEDRCIGAVLTDESGNILEFFHDDNYVSYADQIEDLTDTDIDTTWTDVPLTAPKFTTKVAVIISSKSIETSLATYTYWRTNDQSGSTGKLCIKVVLNGTFTASNTFNVITDDSQTIEIKNSRSSVTQSAVYTHGWYFPTGM